MTHWRIILNLGPSDFKGEAFHSFTVLNLEGPVQVSIIALITLYSNYL